MKIKYLIALGALVLLAGAANFASKNLRGSLPAITPPNEDVTEVIEKGDVSSRNETDFPFVIPEGFKISIFAENLLSARAMAFDELGNMWVSQTKEGAVTLLEIEDGRVIRQNQVLQNLDRPHGLAFDPDNPSLLYIAEQSRVSTLPTYSDGGFTELFSLPESGGHFTRSLLFKNGELLVSVGSSCNVCNESDDRRAKILVSDKDGKNLRDYATGLRNSVFMTLNPLSDEIWATENGRDLLGDDIPPDEINIIREGKNYGWPTCYGKNTHDTDFDKNVYIRPPCSEPFETESYIDLQAHSAPLGLAFVPMSSNWPNEYKNDLIVAYHGSWNRSIPTGYKLVRIKLDEDGKHLGTEDFITGWLTGNSALGRPVDVLIDDHGTMYVSDDHAGVIYKVEYDSKSN